MENTNSNKLKNNHDNTDNRNEAIPQLNNHDQETFSTTGAPFLLKASDGSDSSSIAVDLIFHPGVLLADILRYAGPDGIAKLRNFPSLRKRMSQLSTQDLKTKIGGFLPYDLNIPLPDYTVAMLRTFLVKHAVMDASSSKSTSSSLLRSRPTLIPLLRKEHSRKKEQLSYIGQLALANSSLASDRSLHNLASSSFLAKERQAGSSSFLTDYDKGHLRIVEAVANNANASSQVLNYIANQEMKRRQRQQSANNNDTSSFSILEAVAKHKNTSPSTLHSLSTYEYENHNITSLIARNPNTSKQTLSTILELQRHRQQYESSSCVHVLSGIATNPNSSKQDLLTLSTHPDAYVRSAVARNIHTPTCILLQLANRRDGDGTDHCFHVKLELAGNTSLPQDQLDALSFDANFAIRVNVARNFNTRVDTLERLALEDDTLDVCLAAMNNPKTKNMNNATLKNCEHLLHNDNNDIEEEGSSRLSFKRRLLIASNSMNPTLLEKLLIVTTDTNIKEEEHYKIKYAIARNIHAPEKALAVILSASSTSSKEDQRIQAAVACNPRLPIHLNIKLSQDMHPHIRTCVAKNVNAPPTILDKLSTDIDTGVRECVAQNHQTSGATLSKMVRTAIKHDENEYYDNNNCALLVTIAQHPNTKPEILSMLSRNKWTIVREAVARNPRLPVFHLKELSLDDQTSVIRELSKNSLVQRVADTLSSQIVV